MILSFFTYRLVVIDLFGTELVLTPFGLMLSLIIALLLLTCLFFLLRTYIYCLRFQQVDHYPGPFERTHWHRQAFRRWTRLDEEEENDDISEDEVSSTENLQMKLSISAAGLSSANLSIDLHEMIPGAPFTPSKIFFRDEFKETIV